MPGALERAHEHILARGWALTSGTAIGLPSEADAIAALSPALAPDPRGPGKLHARDVIAYARGGQLPGGLAVTEAESIAHGGADDFPRFRLLGALPGGAPRILRLVPPQLARAAGLMSADYFRYSPGTRSGAHQDKFGDLVIIWVLDRSGGGAESFLTTLDGRDVMRGPLAAGSVLAFRDEMFLHGVTPLAAGGTRDALIFITLRDGAP
jgi:hypothetical protein